MQLLPSVIELPRSCQERWCFFALFRNDVHSTQACQQVTTRHSEFEAMAPSLCKDCVSGSIHEGSPSGSTIDVDGTRVYIAKPEGDAPTDVALLLLTDVFGLDLIVSFEYLRLHRTELQMSGR